MLMRHKILLLIIITCSAFIIWLRDLMVTNYTSILVISTVGNTSSPNIILLL